MLLVHLVHWPIFFWMAKRKDGASNPAAKHVMYLVHLGLTVGQDNNHELARIYIERAWTISLRHVLRWSPHLKAIICRKCFTMLLPVLHSGSVLRSTNNCASIRVECPLCHHYRTHSLERFLEYMSC
eukprot:Gregarina_sp_Poly_1__6284@NODE_3337_length_1172_cov_92_053394_g2113_i0_p2_GENE_NODE_3337_length_1172_cov_92_053394_g2113_i0NODE_3337_length_1172_cov_92_053394_g2113_i0_p2_ORF_typecomplete_len127_score1_36Rpr2/PF04032_16/7_7e09zinc_ribbon_10/PF10058_9/1_3_NODE_3337_length_1172_cov_92_053394_g2113_i044424